MNFKDLLSRFLPSSNKGTSEYYFALEIGTALVTGSVWGIEGSRVKIIRTAQAKLDESVDPTEDSRDLIEKANLALDEALADFMPEPTKILFGVPDFWLQDEDLKPEYLKVLKEMIRQLDVVPMAYVSTTHAICHLLQKEQGVPTTAILVAVSDPLVVTVVKAGKVLGSKTQKRSGNLPEDIEKALITFSDIEVLPSKILIYGKENLEKYKDELTAYNFLAQLPFLHLPKIEELDSSIEIKATSFAGASELAPDVNFNPKDLDIKAAEVEEHRGVGRPFESESLGFVAGDIEEVERKKREVGSGKMEEEVRDEKEDYAVEDDSMDRSFDTSTSFDDAQDRSVEMYEHPERQQALAATSRLPIPLENIKNKILTQFIGIRVGRGVNLALIIPVLLLIGLMLGFIFLPKAAVSVFVDPRILEKDATIVADPGITQVDEPNKKIPGKIVETTVDGSLKGTASGKKKIGDPAKGTVVIYNKTSASKSFSAGTSLVGPDNKTFTLDNSVNIASSSAVEGGISFGKATANVTASEIGPEGNLAAGKELSIKGISSNDASAKVDQAFSGGISKDVTVVTEDDRKKLLAQLTGDLRKKAQEDLQGKMKGDIKVLEEALVEKITKQSFSKNVGDQASEFTLNLTVNLKGTAYSDNDLKMIVSKLVETNVPEGYSLDLSRTETQANVSKVEKDGKLIFAAKFRAKLMPKLDPNQIRKEIAFKTPQEVESKLKGIENVIGADIKLTPSLPGPLQRLPILAQNIKVEVTSK